MSLYDWRKNKLNQYQIKYFFYISYIFNLKNILKNGIYPKNQIKEFNFKSISFAEESVQSRRHQKKVELSNKKIVSIHDLVPLYLCPKTPTLYSRREFQDELIYFIIDSNILCDSLVEFAFTDGNAASDVTDFYRSLYKLHKIPFDVINSLYWNDFEDGKRKKNAEFLIYPKIESKYIKKIIVNNDVSYQHICNILNELNIRIDVEINIAYFFL